MTSVAVLGLNRFGEQVYDYLTDHAETDVLGAFTEESQYAVIEQLEPDFIISAGFDHLIPADILEIPSQAAVNLHPSYLPFNRGVNPDIWSIMRDEPAGVSIHYVTPEMDDGPIIARKQVTVAPSDTARDLRKRLDQKLVTLFKERWDEIATGSVDTVDQSSMTETVNYSKELKRVCEFDRSTETTVGELLDRLRALTFPPYHNAYFIEDGTKYYVRVSITPEDDIEEEFLWDTPTLF